MIFVFLIYILLIQACACRTIRQAIEPEVSNVSLHPCLPSIDTSGNLGSKLLSSDIFSPFQTKIESTDDEEVEKITQITEHQQYQSFLKIGQRSHAALRKLMHYFVGVRREPDWTFPRIQIGNSFDVCDQELLSSINGQAVHLPISQRALCPWAYKVDDDPNRWPRRLPIAFCICDNVKEKVAESSDTPSSSQDDKKLKLDSLYRSYECELIYMTVKVVKFYFDEKKKNSSMIDDFEDMPVACAAIGQTAPSANVEGNLKNENDMTPPVEY